MTVSQNGFPALASSSSLLHKWIIPGSNRHFVMRNGSAGFLLAHLGLWYHEALAPIDGGVWDEWGYAYRDIRGYSVVSNHASGTAIDIDATEYPLGTEHMTNAHSAEIRKRLKLYGGTVRWGGDYSGRKDEMHFEINASLGVCEQKARALIDSKRGKRILKANPGQKAVILS